MTFLICSEMMFSKRFPAYSVFNFYKRCNNFPHARQIRERKKRNPKHILCHCFHKLWIISIRVYLFNLCLLWMEEWLLLYAKRAMLQPCNGENKLQFNEMMIVEQFSILALNNNQASRIYINLLSVFWSEIERIVLHRKPQNFDQATFPHPVIKSPYR